MAFWCKKNLTYAVLGWLLCGGLEAVAIAVEEVTKPLFSFPPQEQLVGHTSWITTVAYSPDGRWIVSAGWDRSLKIWDVATGAEWSHLNGHTGFVYAVAYSPDGRFIVSGSRDKTLKIWDVATGSVLHTLSEHSDEVNAVAYSPDGLFIASGSKDNTVKIWDAATGAEQHTFSGHSDDVNAVAYSPDGRFMASGSTDNTVKTWNVATGTKQRTLSGHTYAVHAVAYSPDGRFIASGSRDGTVNIWNAATGAKQRTLSGHDLWVNAVAYSFDGRFIASGGSDHTVKIWDTATGAILNTFSGHSGWVNALSYSPDGRFIASGSVDTTVKIWPVLNAMEVPLSSTEAIRTLGYNHSIKSLALSPNGRFIVSGSNSDSSIKIWDTSTGTTLQTLNGHTDKVNAVAYSPDGHFIASGGEDETVKIWDATSGEEQRTLSEHTWWVNAVAYSPNGRFIASGGWDDTVKIVNARTGTEQHTLVGHSNIVNALAYSPDGRFIASGSDDHTVKIWDTSTGKEQRTLIGHTDYVSTVAYSPNGRFIVSGSWDDTMKVWNVVTGKEWHTLKKGWWDAWWDTWSFNAVAYSPDGQFIASGDQGGSVKLWKANTGEEIRVFRTRPHTGSITSIAFSPTGRRIYAGSQDRTIKVWNSGLVTTPLLSLPEEQVLGVGESLHIIPLAGENPSSWVSANDNIVQIDQQGIVTAVGEGNVQITAYDADGISQSTLIKVNPLDVGRAIVIAGGDASPNNTLFPYTHDLAQRMYRLLRDRGFTDEDILYFTPAPFQDLDGDGYDDGVMDYELKHPLDELEHAFQDIASTLLPGQQFVLYLHGHAEAYSGEPNMPPTFRLNQNTHMTAETLKTLLDRLPSHAQQILIIDTARSGAFIEALRADNRLILTSTRAEDTDWNVRENTFSHLLMKSLRIGRSLGLAFTHASAEMVGLPGLYRRQTPVLEGSQEMADNTWLGRRGLAVTLLPDIIDMQPLSIMPAIAGSHLWVTTSPDDDIRRVRAQFIALPDAASDTVRDDSSNTMSPHMSFELSYQPDLQRWDMPLNALFTSGQWRIIYEAQNMKGVWSSPVWQEVRIKSHIPQLSNISTRCYIQEPPDYAIAGFVIEGAGSKRVLIRATRSLIENNMDFDLSLELLQLINGEWQHVESNQYWKYSQQAAEIRQLASHLIPKYPNDAALLMSLPPGVYTAIASPINNTFGIGVVSVDDLDSAEGIPSASRLLNISGRCQVQNAPHHAVAGFVVSGLGSLKTLLRGIRSAADTSGVYDPEATLYQINEGTGEVLEQIQNWQQHPRAQEISALPSHLVPAYATDTALLQTLEAGVYTLEITPESGAGIGMVSVDVVD